VDAALSAYPGSRITRIDTPSEAGRSTQLFVTPAEGESLRVFVDPGSGTVLGAYVYTHTLVGFADVMHGSLVLGNLGDAMVELAACWGFVLTVTGLYLWWPRGKFALLGTLLPRLDARGRAFWKSLHGAIGFWSALLVMFLILTGLPWATLWGGMLRAVTEAAGIGYPASYRAHGAPTSTSLKVKQMSEGAAPWTIEAAPAPLSDPHAAHQAHAAISSSRAAPGERSIGIDEVAAIIARAGMSSPYRLSLPVDASGVFAAFSYPDRPQGQRTIYIDQYSANIVGDVGFGDYGWAAKAVELGVQLHMGNYFGRANQIVMLVPCIGIIVLALTGPYMWWRRRPRGSLAAPPIEAPSKVRTLALITIGLGIIFPLAGASLLAVLLFDHLALRTMARLRSSQC
jgi:uncharacterized iron-regulated membrane protein